MRAFKRLDSGSRIMNYSHLISGLVNKVVLFLLVDAGLYLAVTSIGIAVDEMSGNGNSDLDVIVLGLVAIVVVVNMAIAGHALTKKSRAGWQVLVAVAPVLSAFGALTVQLTPYGAVLVAAFAPCLYLLVNPARIDGWTKSILGIDDGAKVTSVLGASGAVLLLVTDRISFAPCPYTFTGLAFAQLAAGFYLMARGFSWRGKAKAEEPIAEPAAIGEVAPAVAVSAYFSLLSWALFPVILIFASKQLAVLSSFGSSLPAAATGILSLVSFTAGASIVALLLILVKRPAIFRLVTLAFLGILGACMATLTLASGLLDGNAILAVRLLSFATIPSSILAMLGAPVPDVKGIAFHFWKVFMMCIGMLLLIVGIEVSIGDPNADVYFMVVYLAVLGIAAVPLAIPSAPRKALEVVKA